MIDLTQLKTAKWQALQENYSEQLPKRLQMIHASWAQLQKEAGHVQAFDELYRQIHSLAGSAATFGYRQVSEQARLLEEYLSKFQDQTELESIDGAVITSSLGQLTALIEQGPDVSRLLEVAHHNLSVSRPTTERLIYIFGDDTPLADEIAKQFHYFGYEVLVFSTMEQAIGAVEKRPPAAMIVDIQLHEGPLVGTEFAKLLPGATSGHIPIVCISTRDDWAARLAAVRAGVLAYFIKPLEFPALVERLDLLLTQSQEEPYRILIVEDAELLAQHYAQVLTDVGMVTEVAIDPSTLLERISAFRPELILMDVYMPGCSGIEAVQVIRQKTNYDNVPIVFLSTENALKKQLSALRFGGDDFLEKPIDDDHLVAAVIIRAQRFRELRKLIVRDGLTGLLNHIELKLELERELARASRSAMPLAFVMLDIDHFKAVNDSYGHLVGDAVIKSLARFLSQRLRKSDIVGRYGGEEFAIVMPDMPIEQVEKIIDQIRLDFSQIPHAHDGYSFNVSFSAGIATVPPYPIDVDELINAADEAMYRAKQDGRNRVCLANASA